MRVRGIEAEWKGAGTCDIDWRGVLDSCRQRGGGVGLEPSVNKGEKRCGQGKQKKKDPVLPGH